MAKTLKKARVYYGNRYSWIGERIAEIQIDDDGSERYIVVSDTGEDALYYASKRSLFDELTAEECVDFDKTDVIAEFETGPVDEFEIEETKMCKSKYYNCFLYLHKLIEKNDKEIDDVVEYTEDYGKDIDEMKLRTLKQCYEREKATSLTNRIILDENGKKKYGVITTKCDESLGETIDAILAEAVIEDKGKRKYLEAIWVSEVDYDLSFEINNKSIHDNLLNNGDVDELTELRKHGHIDYYCYEDAMKSKYPEVVENLAMLISNMLEEKGRFEDYDEEEFSDIEWYKPYKD